MKKSLGLVFRAFDFVLSKFNRVFASQNSSWEVCHEKKPERPSYMGFPPYAQAAKQLCAKFKIRNTFVCLVLLVSLLLSGCVQYDVGVNFSNQNHGELVQHIKLGQRLTSFSGDSVYEWFKKYRESRS